MLQPSELYITYLTKRTPLVRDQVCGRYVLIHNQSSMGCTSHAPIEHLFLSVFLDSSELSVDSIMRANKRVKGMGLQIRMLITSWGSRRLSFDYTQSISIFLTNFESEPELWHARTIANWYISRRFEPFTSPSHNLEGSHQNETDSWYLNCIL